MASACARPQVLVFGEALVDRFADRLVPGGAPFNVARHLNAFGLPALMLTRLGSDALAASLREEMSRYGMDTAGVQIDDARPTGCVDVVESQPGKHEFRIAPVSAYDFYDHEALRSAPGLAGFFRDPGARSMFYYGTLALRHGRSRESCLHLLESLPSQRFLDFNWRAGHIAEEAAWQAFSIAGQAKVNDEELRMLLRWRGLKSRWTDGPPEQESRCEGIANLLAATRITTLIVTYGAGGYAAFSRTGQAIAQGPGIPDVHITDTVGAGDAFSAVTVLGNFIGWPLARTLERANEFAAAICGQRGAVPADLAFYRPWCAKWQLAAHLFPRLQQP